MSTNFLQNAWLLVTAVPVCQARQSRLDLTAAQSRSLPVVSSSLFHDVPVKQGERS